MPQEVIDCVDQLGRADKQPELLTFYDHKGCLIGKSETPGVLDAPEATIPDDDNLGDLNPSTFNYHYGPGEEPENPLPIVIDEEPKFPQPIVKTVEQAPETDIAPKYLSLITRISIPNSKHLMQEQLPYVVLIALSKKHKGLSQPLAVRLIKALLQSLHTPYTLTLISTLTMSLLLTVLWPNSQ
jgi:hypothetical protein